jgi:hypothetical protein
MVLQTAADNQPVNGKMVVRQRTEGDGESVLRNNQEPASVSGRLAEKKTGDIAVARSTISSVGIE